MLYKYNQLKRKQTQQLCANLWFYFVQLILFVVECICFQHMFVYAVDQESSFFLSVLQYFAEKVPLIAAIKETSMLGIMQIGHVEEILGT